MVFENIKLLLWGLLTFIVGFSTQAQKTLPAAGGDAFGSGGTVSYTVGQLVYTTNSIANYSVAQGVQQIYKITTLGTDEYHTIKLEYLAYPNPTVDKLTLKLKNYNGENLKYQLYDMHGRILKIDKISRKNTIISLENLSPAIYFISIIDQQQSLKIFRIIKK